MAAKLKKGDPVIVISGSDKGKQGVISRVFPKENRAIVEGVALVLRHTRQTQEREAGRYRKESSIHMSNLAYKDPKTEAPARIGFRIMEDGKKCRFSKKSGEVLDGR